MQMTIGSMTGKVDARVYKIFDRDGEAKKACRGKKSPNALESAHGAPKRALFFLPS